MGDLRIRIKHAIVTAKHASGARFSKKLSKFSPLLGA